MSGHVCRWLYEGERIRLGFLSCAPDGTGWGAANVMGPRTTVVFPHTSALITRDGRRPVVANANHALVYAPQVEYRRALIDSRGWTCVFVSVDSDVVSGDVPDATVDTRTYMLQYAALKSAAAHDDPLIVEELLYHLLAVAEPPAIPLTGGAHRAHTRRAHQELVEGAKHLLTQRMTERVSLDELARSLHTSAFHLARMFRAHTGYTLYAYRNDLRLKRALVQLSDNRGDLTRLACELGYASLSHFSDSFRGAFGVRPSQV